MRHQHTVVHALVVCAAIGASSQFARAQYVAPKRVAQNTSPPTARSTVQELPMGQPAPAQSMAPMTSGPSAGEGFSTNPYYGCNSSCDTCGCGDGCGDPTCGCGCGDSCGSGCGGGRSGTWFITADYLNVRAHFSDALAFATSVDTNTTPSTTTQHFHQIDFDRESSFRVGGGYKLCCCGEEIVFNFTQLRSSGDASVNAGSYTNGVNIIFPYDLNVLNANTGQTGTVHASVDVDTWDLDWRKTIPLGGSCGSSCGDACGCGDGCGCGDCCCKPSCPAWDITWSGGIRVADAEWDRSYIVNDPQTPGNNSNTRAEMDFDGVGPRVGLEGRRYFGHGGWFSIFAKGDISLLWGQIDMSTRQATFVPGAENVTTELLKIQEVVPVTEIEAGLSVSPTCHSTFSAGYMLSAWHDLGFRGEPVRANVALNTSYDDANILSFDGVFARMEWDF